MTIDETIKELEMEFDDDTEEHRNFRKQTANWLRLLKRFVNGSRKITKVISDGYWEHVIFCNQMRPNCNCGLNDIEYALADYDESLLPKQVDLNPTNKELKMPYEQTNLLSKEALESISDGKTLTVGVQ
jgi:hypothetical protein